MSNRRISCFCFLLLSFAAQAAASTIVVDINGTGDFTEVAPAVDAATRGDTVLVLPGYYAGAGSRYIDFAGKRIVLKSRDGYQSTTLDPHSGFYPVLRFRNGETREAVVEGFTVTGAVQAALVCDGASPTIRACRFTDNRSNNWSQTFTRTNGVGSAAHSSLLIEDCLFDDNYAEARIPTMSFHYCQGMTIRGCTFIDNREGGSNIYDDPNGVIVFWQSDDILIEDCEFVSNEVQDCCVSVWGNTDIDIIDCMFAGNTSSNCGYGEGLLHFTNSGSVEIAGCTISENLCVDSCVMVAGSADVNIDRCTVVANGSAPGCEDTKVIGVAAGSRGTVTVSQTVLAFNDYDLPVDCDGALPAISACCFFESGDPDSMCQPYDPESLVLEDPRFCGIYEDDYTLCLDSPCLVTNNSWGVQLGAHNWGCAACGTPVEAASWGAIKAMYR